MRRVEPGPFDPKDATNERSSFPFSFFSLLSVAYELVEKSQRVFFFLLRYFKDGERDEKESKA